MRFVSFTMGLVAVIACAACGGPSRACTPGASVACIGVGGCSGGQVCSADGSGFGACMCTTGMDGGPVDQGVDMIIIDLGSGTDAPMSVDSGPGVDSGQAMICDSGLSLDTRCATCLGMHCCAEFTACELDSMCSKCLFMMSPACDSNPELQAANACLVAHCSPECA